MAMGGKANTAMFTPRNSRNAVGDIAKTTPAPMPRAFPIRKPIVEA